MPRFFVEPRDIMGGRARLSREDARHTAVLRMGQGDELIICDGLGTDYRCAIASAESGNVTLNVLDSRPSEGEPELEITLFQGLPKSGKMELIIQKCVELGVRNIVPVVTERTVPKINGKNGKNEVKTARWQKLSEEAAKQCGRGVIPPVSAAVSFNEALDMANGLDRAFVAYENERELSLKDAFIRARGVRTGIFIGPEGGFSEEEIRLCRRRGVVPVSLGRRVLRTETAGFVAVIIMLYA